MEATQIDETHETGRRLTVWARRCTEGERGPDGLTDCERDVLSALRRAGYLLVADIPYKRRIVKQETACYMVEDF